MSCNPSDPRLTVRTVLLIANFLLAIAVLGGFPRRSDARVLELASGFELKGDTARIPSLGADLLDANSNDGSRLIWLTDDGLRRCFVSRYQVADVREETERLELIRLPKNDPVVEGNKIGRIGSITSIQPFDKYGRRRVSVRTAERTLHIVQGITEVTAVWTRVQGLRSAKPYVWDMRIATDSIPRDTLRTILENQLDFDDPDVRLSLIRMWVQAEQFAAAEKELDLAIQKFPDLMAMKKELRSLRQLKARKQLDEIQHRQSVGQHHLARMLLEKFPDEGVAQETLLTVSEMIDKYEDDAAQIRRIMESTRSRIDNIRDAREKELYDAFHRELSAELNFNSLPRLAAYVRATQDESMPENQQLAIALSGWLFEENPTENLAVSVSAWTVRQTIRQYLVSDDPQERKRLLESLNSEEAGSPRYVAQLLAAMKPPQTTPGLVDRWVEPQSVEADGAANPTDTVGFAVGFGNQAPEKDAPQSPASPDGVEKKAGAPRANGHFVLPTAGWNKQPGSYQVQLPPAYDANRRYPAIVTLHGAGGTPEQQLDWWAGSHDPRLQMRRGEASRRGYIVIAPAWTQPKQRRYEYSARETAVVLSALRDALHRFSIDTDRVFLSGHAMGGDAVWDMAIAHPDLWAGVVPISATAGYDGKQAPKYVSRCWQNARLSAFYFVQGAFDKAKMDANAMDFNRYLKTTGFDTVIVEYLGRGHEHFHEEIRNIMDWMNVHRRNPAPTKITATIMRPWDNYFWWLELGGVPQRSVVLPAAWPPLAGVRPMEVTGSVRDKKNVVITTGTREARVFLSPEMVDLSEDVAVYVNSRSHKIDAKPSTATILEDARQRRDRKHPFWVKLDLPTGRGR